MTRPILLGAAAALAIAAASAAAVQTPLPKPPDFNRDVRPILSKHCFKCHGPDDGQRKAGLRLDRRDGALALLSTKDRAVVPYRANRSALVRRIFSNGPDQMPPAYAHKPLTAGE